MFPLHFNVMFKPTPQYDSHVFSLVSIYSTSWQSCIFRCLVWQHDMTVMYIPWSHRIDSITWLSYIFPGLNRQHDMSHLYSLVSYDSTTWLMYIPWSQYTAQHESFIFPGLIWQHNMTVMYIPWSHNMTVMYISLSHNMTAMYISLSRIIDRTTWHSYIFPCLVWVHNLMVMYISWS